MYTHYINLIMYVHLLQTVKTHLDDRVDPNTDKDADGSLEQQEETCQKGADAMPRATPHTSEFGTVDDQIGEALNNRTRATKGLAEDVADQVTRCALANIRQMIFYLSHKNRKT